MVELGKLEEADMLWLFFSMLKLDSLCEIKMYDWVICDDLGVTYECELEIFERFSFDYEEGSCLFMYNPVWNYNLVVLLWAL